MDDVLGVEIIKCIQNLKKYLTELIKGENDILPEGLNHGEVALVAVLHYHEDPTIIYYKNKNTFKRAMELNDSLMIHRFHKFYFLFQIFSEHRFFRKLLFISALH